MTSPTGPRTRLWLFDLAGALEREVPSDAIPSHLRGLGVDHARWPLRAGDPREAHAEPLDALRRRHGYQSLDVVRMTPDHPDRAAARAKFLAEHTHDDDETRFFAEGSGCFYLRTDDRVHAVLCVAGDLLRLPPGVRHWFDMGTRPSFCAVRLFSRPDGWVATFTGDPVSERIPTFDALAGEDG